MTRHFSEMTLQEILDPTGHDCSCGRHHACGLRYMKSGPGAIAFLREGMEAIGVRRPFVVMDPNTRAAAGERVEAALQGVPHTSYVFPVEGRMGKVGFCATSLPDDQVQVHWVQVGRERIPVEATI